MKELDKYRDKLIIDRDDLEGCLVNHAKFFWQVSEAGLEASSQRDSLKLEIEQFSAELDEQVRVDLGKKAEKSGGRVTEAAVASGIKSDPAMQKLQNKFLEAKTEADAWAALKEAFHQRGYMLRELVQLEIRRMSIDGEIATTERNAGELRRRKGEAATGRMEKSYDSKRRKG